MKIAKRALALVVSLLMIFSTCAVAASAANGKTLTANYHGTLVIDGDYVLDLNGYALVGTPGKAAIIVKSGNVTIKNGQVESRFAENKDLEDTIKTVVDNSPAAIRVEGGTVTIDGVRAVGCYTPVPTTKYAVPTGNAVEIVNGATVILKNAALFGRYGVNDKVTGKITGKVIVEDALMIGFMDAVKSCCETLAEGTQKFNAAEQLSDFRNNGKPLDAEDIANITKVIGDRAKLYTKAVVADATVTETEDVDVAEVVAAADSSNVAAYSDCSYEYIPRRVVLADGTKVAMVKDGDSYKAEVPADKVSEEDVAQIEYVCVANLQADTAKYLKNLRAYMDKAYNMVMDKLDYTWAKKEYNSYVAELADAWHMITEILAAEIPFVGGTLGDQDEFKALEKALFNIGGATMLRTDRPNDKGQYYLTAYERDRYLGSVDAVYDKSAPLDQIATLLDEFEANFGATLNDTTKWGDIIVWAVELYEDGTLTKIVKDAKTAVDAFKATLEGDVFEAVLDAEPDLKQYISVVDTMQRLLGEALKAIDTAEKNSAFKDGLALIDRHKAELPALINKAVDVYENLETQYINPNDYISGNNMETFYVYADADYDFIEAPKATVKFAVEGNGKVAVDGALAASGVVEFKASEGVTLTAVAATGVAFEKWVDAKTGVTISTSKSITLFGDANVKAVFSSTKVDIKVVGEGTAAGITDAGVIGFTGSVTLTATADAGSEFLYWVNRETNRILSTEATLTLTTTIDRYIDAVFTPVAEPIAAFTNPTGGITEAVPYTVGNAIYAPVEAPFVAGYTTEGWAGAEGDEIAPEVYAEAVSEYYKGSASAFAATNALYDGAGYIMTVRPGTKSLIVTPVYANDEEITIKFIDGAKTVEKTLPFAYTVTYTSTTPGFKYWRNVDTGAIVCVTAKYPVTAIADATFEAVAEGTAVDAVSNVLVLKRDGDKVTAYVERSTSKTMLSTGALLMPVFGSADTNITVDTEGVIKGTSKSTATTGAYALSTLIDGEKMMGASGVVARGYIEYVDGAGQVKIAYSDAVVMMF